jgi:hypothetical protein
VAAHTARQIGKLPPVSILFAAFLGYNPIQHLAGPHVLASLSIANRTTLTGREFFPHLISGPFRTGLHEAFLFAVIACLIAAAASLMRGGRYAAPVLSRRQEERSLDGLDESEPPSPRPYSPVREEQHAG